jgi:hypothetical protein
MPLITSGSSTNVDRIIPVGSSVIVRLIVSSISEITNHPCGLANVVFIDTLLPPKSYNRGLTTVPS